MRTQNRERLNIRPGMPVTITLAKDVPGRETRGNHGEIDYMYVVHGEAGAEAVMFLPSHAAAVMDQSKGRAGDTFEIHRDKGDRYEIIHIADEPQQPQPAARQAAPPSGPQREYVHRQPAAQQATLISQPRPAAPPQQQPAQPTEDERLTQQLQASVNGNSQSQTAAWYSRYLCAAVDAWALAIIYAREKGLQLAPSAADIRAVAATMEISGQQRGGGR